MKIQILRASIFSALTGTILQTFDIYWSWMPPSRIIIEYATAFIDWFVVGLILSVALSKYRKYDLLFDVAMVTLFCSIYLWNWVFSHPRETALPFWLSVCCASLSIGTFIYTRKTPSPEKKMAIVSSILSVGYLCFIIFIYLYLYISFL
jgi:hypothetical protein